jgi:AraC-like DNA-binding protein
MGEVIRQAYGGVVLTTRNPPNTTGFALTQVNAGSFTANAVTLPGGLTFRVRDQGSVLVNTVIQGRVRGEWAKDSGGYQPGDVYVHHFPQAEFRAQTHDARSRTIALPVSLLHAVAGAEHTPAGLRFLSTDPVGATARDQWQNTSDYADRVLANPEAAASRLIIGSTARLLAATALAIFPNTALSGPGARDRSDASPATLRRAMAFIDEHAHEDIAVAEIAAATGVTVRAVQLAFRRHRDTTPLGYLRQVRLDHAHRQLAAADPGQESVTAVAYQWGFTSSSRFAAYYRLAYGVLPSHTLRNLPTPAAAGSLSVHPHPAVFVCWVSRIVPARNRSCCGDRSCVAIRGQRRAAFAWHPGARTVAASNRRRPGVIVQTRWFRFAAPRCWRAAVGGHSRPGRL